MRRKPLPTPKSAAKLLDMYYLHMRSALLETGASFDRIERGRGYKEVASSPPLVRLRKMLKILADGRAERAERILKLLSVE